MKKILSTSTKTCLAIMEKIDPTCVMNHTRHIYMVSAMGIHETTWVLGFPPLNDDSKMLTENEPLDRRDRC